MKCKKCGKKINQQDLNESESWSELGSYYSTKIRYCPYCKGIAIVKYSNEIELDINNDERYYMYSKYVDNI